MASGKRASMREGPLAALFRRTDEDADTTAVAAADAAAAGRDAAETAAPEAPSAPHPSLLAQAEGRVGTGSESEPAVPSPQERLRAAFSSDIPENMLEPPRVMPRADYTRDDERRPGLGPVLRVVGVGGAGVNALNRMIEAEVAGVEFIAINTDQQSLQQSGAHLTLSIGESLT